MTNLNLPLEGVLDVRDMYYSIPRPMTLHAMGLFTDAERVFPVEQHIDQMYRIEARIGAQVRFPQGMPEHARDEQIAETDGHIMRHVYEPVLREARQAYIEMRYEAQAPETKGMKRLFNLIEDLENSFWGRPQALPQR